MKRLVLGLAIFGFFLFSGYLMAKDKTQAIENPWKIPLFTDGSVVYLKFGEHNKKEIIEGLDPQTLQVVPHKKEEGIYLKDKKGVYFFDGFYAFAFIKLKGADPKTFTPLPGFFSKDARQVYYHQSIIKRADPKTFMPLIFKAAEKDAAFEHIGYAFSKDKKHVFYTNKIIPGADPKTFEVLSAERGKDASNYYKWGEVEKKPASTKPVDP